MLSFIGFFIDVAGSGLVGKCCGRQYFTTSLAGAAGRAGAVVKNGAPISRAWERELQISSIDPASVREICRVPITITRTNKIVMIGQHFAAHHSNNENAKCQMRAANKLVELIAIVEVQRSSGVSCVSPTHPT